jgi:hypothetical protein
MEELAEACQEAGYIADPDVDALLFALGKDIEACLTKRANERVYGHTGEDHATRLAYEQWSASIPEEGERAA